MSRKPSIEAAVPALWRLCATLRDERGAAAVTAAFETCANAVSAFETAPGGAWRVEAFAEAEPDRANLAGAAAVAAVAFGATDDDLLAGLTVESLPPRDWLGENRLSFPPLRIGRFFVYGSHIGAVPTAGSLALRIDAATAFGTGEHATTRGCLLALIELARRRPIGRTLDMGTGTGILAMAAARLWHRPVLACDIDAGAVAVAGANLRANGLARQVRLYRSHGYRHPAVRQGRPFDLVLANILARPLARMAAALARHLAEDGVAVLSGLLDRQVPFVLAAHRAHGLVLRRRIAVEGWTTLVLGRGRCR